MPSQAGSAPPDGAQALDVREFPSLSPPGRSWQDPHLGSSRKRGMGSETGGPAHSRPLSSTRPPLTGGAWAVAELPSGPQPAKPKEKPGRGEAGAAAALRGPRAGEG